MTQGQHLEFLFCDLWNQSHFCASLTHHNHEVTAQPQKPKPIGIANFPLLAIIAFTVAADICSAICHPSLIEWALTSCICFPLGCTLPILVSVSPLTPQYITLWEIYRRTVTRDQHLKRVGHPFSTKYVSTGVFLKYKYEKKTQLYLKWHMEPSQRDFQDFLHIYYY